MHKFYNIFEKIGRRINFLTGYNRFVMCIFHKEMRILGRDSPLPNEENNGIIIKKEGAS